MRSHGRVLRRTVTGLDMCFRKMGEAAVRKGEPGDRKGREEGFALLQERG